MKDEILQTSLTQFLKYGIREMSIQKLIAPLGISTKTVYKYFKNKEELLEEVLYLYHNQKYELLQNLPAGRSTVCLLFDIWQNAVETEYKVNNAFFQDLHYYYPELSRKVELNITKKFSDRFIEIIEQGVAEGVFRNDIIPEVVLEGIYALYISVARDQKIRKPFIPLFAIILNTLAAYLRGVSTDKGVLELDAYIQIKQTISNNNRGKSKLLPV